MSRATEGFSARTAIVPDSDAVILISVYRAISYGRQAQGWHSQSLPFESKMRNVLINCGRLPRSDKKSRTENSRFHLFLSLPALGRALRSYRSTGLPQAG